MVAVMLLMFVAGIGLTQAVSDPYAVTLRWLRLGGLIALCLYGLCILMAVTQGTTLRGELLEPNTLCLIVVGVAVVVQLLTVQLGVRWAQRVAAALSFFFGAIACWWALAIVAIFASGTVPLSRVQLASVTAMALLTPGLLGGSLMTMLLGHAYLTAGGEMTQAPFLRLVKMLALLLVLRSVVSVVFGLVPWWMQEPASAASAMWDTIMLTARYLVGLAVPAVFIYMTWDCVRRRANQSATGILYVTIVLIIIGEGTALSLLKSTGLVF